MFKQVKSRLLTKWFVEWVHNENDIETAKQIAKKEGLILRLMLSNRFERKNDLLKPKNKQFYVEN